MDALSERAKANLRALNNLGCRITANAFQKPVAIGTTAANGDCFFDSVRMLFEGHEALREALGEPLTIHTVRSWVSELFTPDRYDDYSYILNLWKSQYEDAKLSRNVGDCAYYEFIRPVMDYLPPSEGMLTRLEEWKQELKTAEDAVREAEREAEANTKAETDNTPEVETPPSVKSARFKRDKLLRKTKTLEAYIEKETKSVDTDRAMREMAEVVLSSSFWGEEISINATVARLADIIKVPIGFFIVTRRSSDDVNITAIVSHDKDDEENCVLRDGVYAFFYYTGGHYQPFKVEGRLLHTLVQLPKVVFEHWRVSEEVLAEVMDNDNGETGETGEPPVDQCDDVPDVPMDDACDDREGPEEDCGIPVDPVSDIEPAE